MAFDELFELVCQCLPREISPSELLPPDAPQEEDGGSAHFLEYALGKCWKIDWDAYLANNPDVLRSGMDPASHFVKHGVYEGRKLFARNRFYRRPEPDSPKISIIVTNIANADYLKKCLDSIIRQSLENIEAIVVDSGRDAMARKAASDYASSDHRITVFAQKDDCDGITARKLGLSAARGTYVMFLEGSDQLESDACEIAWNAIAKGNDIAGFGANVVGDKSDACQELNIYLNYGNAGTFSARQLLELTYVTHALHWNICGKIFDRCLAQYSYAELEQTNLGENQDMYEYLALCANSRGMFSSKKKIWSRDSGKCGHINHANQAIIEKLKNIFVSIQPIRKLCARLNLERIFNSIRHRFFLSATWLILDLPGRSRGEWFKKVCDSFGILYSVTHLARVHYLDGQQMATFFPRSKPAASGPKKRIGIFYYRLSPGGLERTVQNMCKVLAPAGYEISLFLEEKSEHDLEIPACVKKYYLASSVNVKDAGERHLADLYAALEQARPELVFYMYLHEPGILWDALLMRMMGIDVIGSLRIDINFEMIYRGRKWTLSSILAVSRCLNKLFCLNVSTELYLRSEGVDATFIPNTIANFECAEKPTKRENIILVSGRLQDCLKYNSHSLRVMAEVAARMADATMVFIGDFPNPDRKREFLRMADALGVRSRIQFTGWLQNPAALFHRAKILFSASLMEGFPNGIAEAQKMGLPVVMYDLDVVIADDNEGIVRVKAGDARAAAGAICALLRDDELWRRASALSAIKARRFSDERFRDNIINLINTYDKYSILNYYSPADYQKAIRYMTRYAGMPFPKFSFL